MKYIAWFVKLPVRLMFLVALLIWSLFVISFSLLCGFIEWCTCNDKGLIECISNFIKSNDFVETWKSFFREFIGM
jgi:CHASE2 domain-containing sensor protein